MNSFLAKIKQDPEIFVAGALVGVIIAVLFCWLFMGTEFMSSQQIFNKMLQQNPAGIVPPSYVQGKPAEYMKPLPARLYK